MSPSVSSIVWLDSANQHLVDGQRSLLVLEMRRIASLRVGDEEVWVETQADLSASAAPADPWARLDQLVADFRGREPSCPAGLVAWLSYESGFLRADGPSMKRPTAPIPLLEVYESQAALVEEHGVVQLITRGETVEEAKKRARTWLHRMRAVEAENAPLPPLPQLTLREPGDRAAYHAAITRILAAIAGGELQQVCPTYPIRLERPKALDDLYLHLRARSPASYCAFLRLPEIACASTSPERLFSIEGRTISARPMKGTRKRGVLPDAELAKELQNNPKDRSENKMIADLLLDELRGICTEGSAAITEAFSIEFYANVLQMTSTVEGQLAEGVGPFSAFAALSPPGSMTGFPKVAACRLLEELEPSPRGLYSGSIAWIDGGVRAQFSVVIRSLQAWGDEASWHVGGGIVAASNAADEWDESRAKAATLLDLWS